MPVLRFLAMLLFLVAAIALATTAALCCHQTERILQRYSFHR